jgi:hypothetical protein
MQWQPIETAPRNGRKIIVSDGFNVTMAWYVDDEYAEADEGEPGWYEDEFDVMLRQPTHWMPLPEPPR